MGHREWFPFVEWVVFGSIGASRTSISRTSSGKLILILVLIVAISEVYQKCARYVKAQVLYEAWRINRNAIMENHGWIFSVNFSPFYHPPLSCLSFNICNYDYSRRYFRLRRVLAHLQPPARRGICSDGAGRCSLLQRFR